MYHLVRYIGEGGGYPAADNENLEVFKMAKVKTTGMLLKDTLVFGAGMMPISEFPERFREGVNQLSADGKKTYGIPGIQAMDLSGESPRGVQGNVYVNITDVESQAPIEPGKTYAPSGRAIVGIYSIDGKELVSVSCERLVPVSELEQKRA